MASKDDRLLDGISAHAKLRRAKALVFVEDLEDPVACQQDAHHLTEVLRLHKGDHIIASNGLGSMRTCTLPSPPPAGTHRPRREQVGPKALEVTGDIEFVPRELQIFGVGFAMAKSDRSEWAVQKLTELGASEIWPFISKRSVVRLGGSEALRRGEKLRRVALEAAAQCRRVWLPRVHDPVELEVAARELSKLGQLAFAEPGGTAPSPDLAAILIGPEGGWTPDELAIAPCLVRLSDAILRVETAAITSAVILAGLRSSLQSES